MQNSRILAIILAIILSNFFFCVGIIEMEFFYLFTSHQKWIVRQCPTPSIKKHDKKYNFSYNKFVERGRQGCSQFYTANNSLQKCF